MTVYLVVTQVTERDATSGVVLRCAARLMYATRVQALAAAQAVRWGGAVVAVELEHAYAGPLDLAAWTDPGQPAPGMVGR